MELKYGPYSPSRLDTANCGYAFKRLYIDTDKQKRIESLPQARGSAVHEVLAHLTQELVQSKTPSFTDQFLRSLVAEAIAMHPAAAQETKEILQMTRLYLLNPPDPLTADAEIEQDLAVTIEDGEFVPCDYDDPRAYARGRVDIKMISDDLTHAIIYDHKTQPHIETADTFQLGFYAWLMFKTHPFLEEVQTILHFARYGKYSQPYVWRREELLDIEDEIITRVTLNETRTDWSATPNKHCQYCPFLSECPAMEQYVERDGEGRLRPKQASIKILGDTNKALLVAGAVTVLENLVSEMKKELRAHVEFANAPIAIPGVRYGYVIKENVIDWDYANKHQREQIYEIFEKHKVDPRHFMGFSQTFSSKIWQAERPALSRDLNAILKRETKSEFRASKI